MVNYINTAPIYEIWKEKDIDPCWQIIEGEPARLNRMLAAGELDLGFVSSCEYAARPDLYQIFADLSISATGAVGSVFLFSDVPLTELDGKSVLLTGQSDTSVFLLKIILEEFYGVSPDYHRGQVFGVRQLDEEPAAILAIGDEALRLSLEDRFAVRLDLSEVWHGKTGLPFVFAVCAVREDFLRCHREEVSRIHQTLLFCRAAGLARLSEICERVAKRIPMDSEACSDYLHGMEYDLQFGKQQALNRFFSLLIARGDADKGSLPLKIFS
jgi:chorismate dehydratase